MKILTILTAASIAVTATSCATSSPKITSADVSNLVNSNNFTFMAERANPTNYDVIRVMNSIPNSVGTRILDLDYGYSVQLKENELTMELPYFGRMYNPSYDTTKNSFRFVSKDFTTNKTAGRKDGWIVSFYPKDVSNVKTLNLEIYKNGRAFLSVDANDRQPITYSGYVLKNAAAK